MEDDNIILAPKLFLLYKKFFKCNVQDSINNNPAYKEKNMSKRKQKQQQEQTTGNLHPSHCVVIIYLSFSMGIFPGFFPSNYSILFPSLHSWFQFWLWCDTGEVDPFTSCRSRAYELTMESLLLSTGLTQGWAYELRQSSGWIPACLGENADIQTLYSWIEKHVPLRAAGCNTESS